MSTDVVDRPARNQVAAVLAELEHSPDATRGSRRERAERLVAAVNGDRTLLEEASAIYLRRLHEQKDDFAATEALRVVTLALALIPPAWSKPRLFDGRGKRRRS